MGKSIQKTEIGTFFSLKDGSNYKVMMTYDREEIVEFEQFKRIVQMLNDSNYKFITINQRIVNKNTIIDISPTDKKTEIEKEVIRNNPQEVIIDDGNGNPIRPSELVNKQV